MSADKPLIVSRLPLKTVAVYLILGVLGCGTVSALHIININWEQFGSVHTILDLLTGILFFGLAISFLIRSTRRLDLFNDRIIRRSITGKKEQFFKDFGGHHVDDSDNMTLAYARGYFRGIIVKQKNGKHFSLNRAELSQFDSVKKHFKTRCKHFNNQSIKKLVQREDRKLSLYLIVAISLIIASMLH